MSFWTHISGVITVSPLGRSQPEKKYILDTVLQHLPKVTGSDTKMNVYVIQKNGYDTSTTHDEFGQWSNLGNDIEHRHSFKTQSRYLLVVEGDFRDRLFHQTLREFNEWLCRLAKRILVVNIVVELTGELQSYMFNNYQPYYQMWEESTWLDEDKEPNWCEALMWDEANSGMPIMLEYKYYNNKDNDAEVARRFKYRHKVMLNND